MAYQEEEEAGGRMVGLRRPSRLSVVAAGGDANSDNQRREARQAGKKHKSVGGQKRREGGSFIAV